MTRREMIEKWAVENYGESGKSLGSVFPTIDITLDGELYADAIIFGNNECWMQDEFYQYMLCGDKLYRAYYDTEDIEELDDINYSSPYKIESSDDVIESI